MKCCYVHVSFLVAPWGHTVSGRGPWTAQAGAGEGPRSAIIATIAGLQLVRFTSAARCKLVGRSARRDLAGDAGGSTPANWPKRKRPFGQRSQVKQIDQEFRARPKVDQSRPAFKANRRRSPEVKQSGPKVVGANRQSSPEKERDQFLDMQAKIPVEVSPRPDIDELGESWASAKLSSQLASALHQQGLQRPTASQRWAVPLLLAGKDLMVCSQTGSGKTVAYLLPLLESLLRKPNLPGKGGRFLASPGAVVIAPTRELAAQIASEAAWLTRGTQLSVACVFGGVPYQTSKTDLRGGADLLVATPGRLEDVCQRGHATLQQVRSVVLDEADRLLDLGFEDQIRLLLTRRMPKAESRQTAMFSATFGTGVQHLAADFLDAYTFVAVGRVGSTAKTVEQRLVWSEDANKPQALLGTLLALDAQGSGSAIVFVNTKDAARMVEDKVRAWKFRCFSIHGDKKQEAREKALQLFRTHVEGTSKSLAVLVATDVAARGLDIPNISCVVHYDLPRRIDDYVHRTGRTGRVGRSGVAVGFANLGAKAVSGDLVRCLAEAGGEVPSWLMGMAISTGDALAVSNGSQKYGAQDVRLEGAGVQTAEERREAQKLRSFAADAYESDEKAFGSDMPTFQPSPQNPEVKLLFHRGDGNAIPDFGDNA
ncbi:unnamed protein product [Effrenium voratum]|nr:unnamed protein product [Effrenium voratum]